MFGASHVTVPPFIVCEDATNGNLAHFLVSSEANKKQMWKLLHEAAQGLEYLHVNQIVHGDLKLNNILVGEDGKARIADFGLSTVKASSRSTQSRLHSSADTVPVAGGLRWRAPECFTKRPSFSSDVYSFAMCIIEAATDEPPFAFLDDGSVISLVRSGVLPDQPEQLSDEAWALVEAMAKRVPSERLALSGVLLALKMLAQQEREARQREVVCVCGSQQNPIEGVCNECWRPRSQHQAAVVADEEEPVEETKISTTTDNSPTPVLRPLVHEVANTVRNASLQDDSTTVATDAVGYGSFTDREHEETNISGWATTEHDDASSKAMHERAEETLNRLNSILSRQMVTTSDTMAITRAGAEAVRSRVRTNIVEIPDGLSQENKDQLKQLRELLLSGAISQAEYDELVPFLLTEDTEPVTAPVAARQAWSGLTEPIGSFSMVGHRVAIHGGYLECQMHRTQVLQDDNYTVYTVYVLRCQWHREGGWDPTTWLVSHRYSVFERLDKDLKAKIPTTVATLPPFPRKYRFGSLFGMTKDSNSAEIVDERKRELGNYLGQLLELCGRLPESLNVPELDRFLNVSRQVEQFYRRCGESIVNRERESG